MSNIHNLSFLQHIQRQQQPPSVSVQETKFETIRGYEQAQPIIKSDIEKNADILELLKKQPEHRQLDAHNIRTLLGIDLLGADKVVLDLISKNPKIEIIDSDTNYPKFRYQPKFPIHDRNQLLRIFIEYPSGVKNEDLIDCYPQVMNDLEEFIESGKIIAVKNAETRQNVYYPRGKPFLVKLSGQVYPSGDDHQVVRTTSNLIEEIRRGDAVCVLDHWFRVSSRVQTNSGQKQPARAIPSLSVSSMKEMSQRNVYEHVFDETRLPLSRDLIQRNSLPSKSNSESTFDALRYGCTNDVRSLWLETAAQVPVDDFELDQKMLGLKLIEKGEGSQRKRIIQTKQKN